MTRAGWGLMLCAGLAAGGAVAWGLACRAPSGPPPLPPGGPPVDYEGTPLELAPEALAPAVPPDAPGALTPAERVGAFPLWLQSWIGRSSGTGPLQDGETVWAVQLLHTDEATTRSEARDYQGAHPTRVTRAFHLDDDDVFLGEPVLVRYDVHVAGNGPWDESSGGAYRGAGRDENFFILARDAAGRWVPTALSATPSNMGGLSGGTDLQSGARHTAWLPLQGYVALTRPGTYTLYCFHLETRATLIGARADLVAIAESARDPKAERTWNGIAPGFDALDEMGARVPVAWYRTLARIVPAAATRRAKGWNIAGACAYARLRLTVRAPSAADRAAFVARWSKVVGPRIHTARGDRARAANNAIAVDRDPSFMPLLERWTAAATNEYAAPYQALAMRGTPRAVELLLAAKNDRALQAFGMLPAAAVPAVVPRVLQRLDAGGGTANVAQGLLMCWAGDFQRRDPPKRTPAGWRAWWAARAGTTPRRLSHGRWEWPAKK